MLMPISAASGVGAAKGHWQGMGDLQLASCPFPPLSLWLCEGSSARVGLLRSPVVGVLREP